MTTARGLAFLAAISACTPAPDVGLGVAITPDGVSPSVSVTGGAVSLDAGAGGVSAGLSAGIVGVTLSN